MAKSEQTKPYLARKRTQSTLGAFALLAIAGVGVVLMKTGQSRDQSGHSGRDSSAGFARESSSLRHTEGPAASAPSRDASGESPLAQPEGSAPPPGWQRVRQSPPAFLTTPSLEVALRNPEETQAWLATVALGPDDLPLVEALVVATGNLGELSPQEAKLRSRLDSGALAQLKERGIEALGTSPVPAAQDALSRLYTRSIDSNPELAGAILSQITPQPKSDSQSYKLYLNLANGSPHHPHFQQAISTLGFLLASQPALENELRAQVPSTVLAKIHAAKAQLAHLPSGDPVTRHFREQHQ